MITVVFDPAYSSTRVRVFDSFIPGLDEVILALPDAEWSAREDCWTLPLWHAHEIALKLPDEPIDWRGFGLEDAATGRRKKQARTKVSTPKDTSAWAQNLFTAVGPDRGEQVFRVLTRILHPDSPTGDTELMRQLISARGRTRGDRR
jgi:hypothetical protein